MPRPLLHAWPAGHAAPHVPPQPSLPQSRPAQLGMHAQVPEVVQLEPAPHIPQMPPHPSGPHCLPVHDSAQPHWLEGEHVWLAPQVPHEPPHPSLPHCLPAHCGVHAQPAGNVPPSVHA